MNITSQGEGIVFIKFYDETLECSKLSIHSCFLDFSCSGDSVVFTISGESVEYRVLHQVNSVERVHESQRTCRFRDFY
jgi:hypothetical protein